jgi:putative membrane-bound dehydrogenase-like protein
MLIRFENGLSSVVAFLMVALFAVPVSAQQRELIPHAQDRPPGPALSPAEAVAKMKVPEGFRVEVVAAEPDIVNPVAMTFDERGRIWITESLEYPRRTPGKGRDRVKVLEDTDGDGRADKFTVFADGLNIPSGIAVGHGGVWVANSPDILFLRDTDGDGKADRSEVVVTGFGRDDTHELPNSLTWGPDGWLYGWNGVFNRSVVKHRGKTFDFTCAIFRIHPKTREFELWCEGTSNPWGIAINENGDFFASACVIDHLWHLTETGYYIRQGGPYPPYTWPIGSIVDHQHQKAAYCGIHYFDSSAYPEKYRGKLFMGNIHGNCINVDSLERNGSTYHAKPEPDFLSANDAWFMPVVQKTGPDGCLYILDWYDRYHCYQDANRDPAGIDRLKGRLYRVRYKDTPRRVGFDLAKESDDALIKQLGSDNVYDRETAVRLLCERTSAEIRSQLETLVLDESASRKARMHGLFALVGSGPLRSEFHVKLFEHSDPTIRAWAVRAAGNMKTVAPEVSRMVRASVSDKSPGVSIQAAIAARKVDGLEPSKVLLDVLNAGSNDPLIPQIVWRALAPMLDGGGGALSEAIAELDASKSPGVRSVIARSLDRLLGLPSPDAKAVAGLLDRLLASGDTSAIRQAYDSLAARLRQRNLSEDFAKPLRSVLELKREPRSPVAPECQLLLAYIGGGDDGLPFARDLFERGSDEARRLRALDAIIFMANVNRAKKDTSMFIDSDSVSRVLNDPGHRGSVEFRGRMLGALSPSDDPQMAPMILKAYPTLEPELKPKAIELLTNRPLWARALLSAVEAKAIPSTVLNVNQLRKLQNSKDADVVAQFRTMFGTIREGRNPQRELLVDQMRGFLKRTPGDPVAGQAIFTRLCAQCHKIYGEGQDVGPDITNNGRNDFDQMISNVFDPSLVIGSAYQATTVATKDGRVLTGLLAEDSPQRIVLKTQGGKAETIPQADVDEKKLSEVSLMPEDVEKQLTPREIADLFAFLALDKPPSDPTGKLLIGAPRPVKR